jgi:aminopeptidase N
MYSTWYRQLGSTVVSIVLLFGSLGSHAQVFPSAGLQSQRGANGSDRRCMDVGFYQLNIRVQPADSSIGGFVRMVAKRLLPDTVIHLDLSPNFTLDSIVDTKSRKKLGFMRDSLALFVNTTQSSSQFIDIKMYYHGKPQQARRAPWDGGFVWSSDSLGRMWIGVACQGEGASLWWPCKDLPNDEPDSVSIQLRYPDSLTAVCNGKPVFQTKNAGWKETIWKVNHPINLYDISLNLAQYKLTERMYTSVNGKRYRLEFWHLDYHQWGAEQLLADAAKMLTAFEQLFGPYPFWKDGYKLVETPYWGMEHQSCVAYGNNFKRNEFGFDFILVHESGHEWFGNALSSDDRAHDWLHESLTTYAESLYLAYWGSSNRRVLDYLQTQKKRLALQMPMVGKVGVYDNSADIDIYFKGAWMLHGLRCGMDSINSSQLDSVSDLSSSAFVRFLRRCIDQSSYKTTNTEAFLQALESEAGKSWRTYAEQYLFYADIPRVEFQWNKKRSEFRMRLNSHDNTWSIPLYIGNKQIPLSHSFEQWYSSADFNAVEIALRNYLFRIDDR